MVPGILIGQAGPEQTEPIYMHCQFIVVARDPELACPWSRCYKSRPEYAIYPD